MPRKRSGPPYRRIVVTYWNDPDVKRVLSLEEKAVLAYLFSNEHSHPCGLYRLPPRFAMDELDLSLERFHELLAGPIARFATYDWRTEEVFVHNMAEHQIDGGLHGQDRRIQWVVTQLQTIHSEDLVARFADRYSDWNVDFEALGVEKSKGHGMGHGMPLPKPHNDAKREGASDAPGEGAWEASPSPSPSPSRAIQPPSQSSGDTLGREGLEGVSIEGRVVFDRLRDFIRTHWHMGSDEVELDNGSVGMGAEALNVDVLVKRFGAEETEGAIRTAPTHFGFSEPTTLRWFTSGKHGGSNFHEALSVWRASNGRRAASPEASALALGLTLPGAGKQDDEEPDPEAIADARAWLSDQDDDVQARVLLLVKANLRVRGYGGDVERAPLKLYGPAVLESVRRVRGDKLQEAS